MIIDPNTNPEEIRMEQTQKARTWDALKMKEAEIDLVVLHLENLKDAIKDMRLNGPVEALENISKYIAPRNTAYTNMQMLIDSISKWETSFFTWMAHDHGEEVVQQKLSKAMKGTENE